MTRWYVGVKADGQREVFGEFNGDDPIAESKGYVEVCGPYRSERDATQAAKSIRQNRRDRSGPDKSS
jgi:hypothetical protein